MATSKKELAALTIMELRTFAREQGVSLRRNWKKDEIVNALLRSVNPKRGRKPKPARQPAQPKAVTKPAAPASRKAAAKVAAAAVAKAGPAAVKEPSTRPAQMAQPAAKPTPVKTAREKLPGPAAQAASAAMPASVTLMVRNAHVLFAFWDVPASDLANKRGQLTLRIHDLTSGDAVTGKDYYDVPLSPTQTSLYVLLRLPGHRFVCEIGILQHNGRFVPLAQSEKVETPVARVRPTRMEAVRFFQRVYGLEPGKALQVEQLMFVFSGSNE